MVNTEKKRKKLWIAAAAAAVTLAAGGAGGWYYFGGGRPGRENTDVKRSDMAGNMENAVIAGGAIRIGMTEVKFELEELDTELTIEEVYLSRGDEVEAGSKILKISGESIEEAKNELSGKAEEAELAYRKEAVENQASLIEAKEEYDVTLAAAEYAQNEYDKSLREAQKEIDELKEQAEDAKKLYDEYYDGIYNRGYEEEYELAGKKELYEQNEALYWDSLKKFNIDDKEVNNPGASSGGSGGSPGGGNTAALEERKWKITAMELLEDTYRAEKEEYEQALEDYKNAVAKAEAGIEQAKTEYDLLVLKLRQAQIDYEKKASACLADYEAARAKGASAESVYETTVKKLEGTLGTLLNEKEEAEENLSIFEAAVGDGYLYTENKGTVVMVAVSEEGTLEPDALVLAYSNPEAVTVTAAVDQADIASVEIGEIVSVVTQENEIYKGMVTQIDPVSSSSSRASVTYSVEITLEGDTDELDANNTVTAYFGIEKDRLESERTELNGQPAGFPDMERPSGQDGTDTPDKAGMPDMPQQPDGGNRS